MAWWLVLLVWYLELQVSLAIGFGLATLHTKWQDKKLEKKQKLSNK